MSILIIFDANVIIKAHELGLWKTLRSQRKVSLPTSIIDEVKFFTDRRGNHVDIDLRTEVAENLIAEIEVDIGAMAKLYADFSDDFVDSIDPGEQEALAFLYSNSNAGYRFCSGDKRALAALGTIGQGTLGISLEQVLNDIGKSNFLSSFGASFTTASMNRNIGTG